MNGVEEQASVESSQGPGAATSEPPWAPGICKRTV
jgi:hypothetical protein